ncbi:PREDICTED: PRUPE_3G214300 [Prunus dulcis]|uniref:PREDICTED: PRUPE_3G214300 n=1 Tax=Prunus dulcis TaxID=3755 RepID=A0A5E4G0W6_PRUDU|nr:PREDICTED: PRUPE_3G214300 [Prunus dulcis]
MDTLDQLRNRRCMGMEGWQKGIAARKVRSSASAKINQFHRHLGSVEKPKTHGSGRTAQVYCGPQVEKPKAHGSGRTAQGYWEPQGQLKHKRQKKIMDTLDQLRNRRGMGQEGQLRVLGSARSAQAQVPKIKI